MQAIHLRKTFRPRPACTGAAWNPPCSRGARASESGRRQGGSAGGAGSQGGGPSETRPCARRADPRRSAGPHLGRDSQCGQWPQSQAHSAIYGPGYPLTGGVDTSLHAELKLHMSLVHVPWGPSLDQGVPDPVDHHPDPPLKAAHHGKARRSAQRSLAHLGSITVDRKDGPLRVGGEAWHLK